MKKIIISLIFCLLISSCNLKLWWETNISTKDWKLNIKTNSNNEVSIWTDDIKSWIKNASNYIKNNANFLQDVWIVEKILNKASDKISETWIKTLQKSINLLEEKYNKQIEKNLELKKYIVEAKKESEKIKNWLNKENLKNTFNQIKQNLDKIRKILQK